MSQQVKVMRAIDFHNQGAGAVLQTIDCDTHANIIYWKPTTTDTGAIYFGDGTTDLDIKIFLGSTTEYVLFDVGNSRVGFACPLVPATSDGAALGTTALMFSDLFLASAGVINFNAGDVTITHGSDLLTIAGGGLTMGASGTPAGDFTLFGTQATLKVWFDVNGDTNGAFYFGADDYGLDVAFYGQTASNSMIWDASANALVFTAGGITMGVASSFIAPVRSTAVTTNGAVWVDTDTSKLHFYYGAEYYVTASAA